MRNAQRRAAEAEVLLRDVELTAIKSGLLNEARALIAKAEEAKVERFAPRSLQAARRHLADAEQELQRNRYELGLPRRLAAGTAEAACFTKSASGTAGSIDGAKFPVKKAILQSFDWGVWAAFMATGSTPGYRVTSNGYKCSPGGLGYNCRGTSTICKTG